MSHHQSGPEAAHVGSASTVGALLAAATGVIVFALPREMGLELLAMAMVLIGAAYYGFAFAQNDMSTRIVEVATATVFVVFGVLGLWVSVWFIMVGLIGHGFWDLLHHRPKAPFAPIPRWYIPFCVIYDWVAAAIVMVWALQ